MHYDTMQYDALLVSLQTKVQLPPDSATKQTSSSSALHPDHTGENTKMITDGAHPS